jgi:hypothetical protein
MKKIKLCGPECRDYGGPERGTKLCFYSTDSLSPRKAERGSPCRFGLEEHVSNQPLLPIKP